MKNLPSEVKSDAWAAPSRHKIITKRLTNNTITEAIHINIKLVGTLSKWGRNIEKEMLRHGRMEWTFYYVFGCKKKHHTENRSIKRRVNVIIFFQPGKKVPDFLYVTYSARGNFINFINTVIMWNIFSFMWTQLINM